LTVSDTLNRFGKCESSLQTYLKLEAKKLEEAIIASTPFTLQKEPPKTVLQSKAWAYIILMLLLTGAAWSWLQWLMRPLLETAPKDYFKSALSKSAKPLTELIQPTFLQFEIANLLRKRQAGRRKEMALSKTLKATVEKSGYSELHYQFKTKPTEYIALVDLTNHTEDQKALANYLPDFFSKQDVLIHPFFYENDFDKIWSTRFPKGISLRKLYEFYPENRLLIFGNTQQLVHNWQQHQQLPKAWEQLSNQWEHQVVCTNTAIPDQFFSTLPYDTPLSFFPANLSGIGQAIDFLEEKVANDSEQEATWVNQTATNPSANQSFDEAYHLLFQNKYPKIYQWFLALNIYPSADLSNIIAIGKALKIEPTYDNLQLIAPIANLQKNNFDKTLWLNNWALKNNLIIQEFALQPFEVEQQKKVRYLFQTEQLSDLQLTELDLIVQRHTTNYRTGKINGETFVNFLNEELKKRKKASIPWNIPYFWWAVGLSLAALLLGSSMYFSDGDFLNNRFHIAKSEAARLNNLAVDYYTEELPLPEKQATNSNKLGINFKGINLVSTTTSQFLEQAILVDSVFEKAHLNYQKLMYNDGLKHYQSYVENNTYPLVKAKYPLTQAIKYHQFKDTTVAA